MTEQLSKGEALQFIAECYQEIDTDSDVSDTKDALNNPEKALGIVNLVLFSIRAEKESLERHRDDPEGVARDSITAISPLKDESERGFATPRDILSEMRLGGELKNISGTWDLAISNLSAQYDKVVTAANVLGIPHNNGVVSEPDDPER